MARHTLLTCYSTCSCVYSLPSSYRNVPGRKICKPVLTRIGPEFLVAMCFVGLANQLMATRQFVCFFRPLKKQRLKQFVWGAWHFCTEVKCSSATQHHYIPPPVSGLSMALGYVDQYVCASCVFYYPDLFSALRQMPDRCARALPKKAPRVSARRLFRSVYLIGGISTCLHSSSVPFFRQMLRPQRGRACNWVVV